MPDAFFQSQRKRKRPSAASSRPYPSGSKPRAKPRAERDESVSSAAGDSDDQDLRARREEAERQSDDELLEGRETAAEKRVRMARGYLEKVRGEIEAEQADGDFDAAEIDRELIASRLQKDVAEQEGRIHTYLASSIVSAQAHFLSTPSEAPTSAAITPKYLYASTKQGKIHRFSLPSLTRIKAVPGARSDGDGHKGEILCLAASDDGKWLVSGGRDKVVGVWDVSDGELKWVKGMRGHKDAVSSIALPPLNNPSYHILTASLSRHLALSSISTLSTIDTFFGHQDSIASVSSLKPTVAVTSGGRDRTCRWWKVEEEVQLVFRGGGRSFENPPAPPSKENVEPSSEEPAKKVDRKGKGREFVEGAIDTVCMLDDQHYVSGGDSGAISLWHTGKKKPIFTQHFAHGIDPSGNQVEGGARWITSLAALRGTDLFASGSWDGSIRLWALDPALRNFKPASLPAVDVPGFINALQIASLPAGSVKHASWNAEESEQEDKREIVLVAAVAREPRLGRWLVMKEGVKAGVLVVRLNTTSAV